MKKLNLAIIGQGRSGRDIHGKFYLSDSNVYYNVKYVVDADEHRRAIAKEEYAGATILSDYTELFAYNDIDLVVNASYSEMHYAITKDLLEHKFNVLSEKPFARNRYECDVLIKTAKENGVVLAVFHNSQPAPMYVHAKKLIDDGVLGDVKQISIFYNNFARRWDWQTLQKKLAGSVYNTGPHPIAMALGFLDFDKNTRVAFSKLDCALTSGDGEDYAKFILVAPGKPVIDLEINSTDAFSDFNLKIQGSKGTLKSNVKSYELKYIKDGENPERPVEETFIHDDEWKPIYCREKLEIHEEAAEYNGTAFNSGTAKIYENVYNAITKGEPLLVTCEMAADVVGIMETLHAENPLPLKY